jgi:hypothetical protein
MRCYSHPVAVALLGLTLLKFSSSGNEIDFAISSLTGLVYLTPKN